jgi:hypothetical protein
VIDAAISAPSRDEETRLWRKVNEGVFEDTNAIFIEKIVDRIVMRADIAGYLHRGDRASLLYHRLHLK